MGAEILAITTLCKACRSLRRPRFWSPKPWGRDLWSKGVNQASQRQRQVLWLEVAASGFQIRVLPLAVWFWGRRAFSRSVVTVGLS